MFCSSDGRNSAGPTAKPCLRAPFRKWPFISIQQGDLVAGTDGALDENGAVDAGLTFMIASQSLHDLGARLCRVGIERHYFAARVAFQHGDLRSGTNP